MTSSQAKLQKLIKKHNVLFNRCAHLRLLSWSKLLECNLFQKTTLEEAQTLLQNNKIACLNDPGCLSLLPPKELQQIRVDVKRCEHFHPLFKLESAKEDLEMILQTFILLNEDCSYIQGLDSVSGVLYTEFYYQ